MGSIVIAVVIFVFLVIFPFKLAASWFGAERSDWVSCIVAVFVAGTLGGGLAGILGGGLTWAFFGALQGLLSLALVLLISGLTNRFVLGTTFVRGVLISVVGALIVPGVFVAALWVGTKGAGA